MWPLYALLMRRDRDNGCSYDLSEEIKELMLDVLMSQRESFRINGEEIPAYDVKMRFMKLKKEHISYAVYCLDHNTTNVVNMRNYMITTLYNAFGTHEQFWKSRIRHDEYVEKEKSSQKKSYAEEFEEMYGIALDDLK